MTLSTLTDDALTAEFKRVNQKIADLERDLNALYFRRIDIRAEDHRRFCDRVRHMTEGK